MKFSDQFRFVRQNMKKNKTRIFMTILATAMSCTFLIVLASVGFGLHRSVVKEVTENRAVTEIEVAGKEINKEYQMLTDKDIQYLESIKNVKTVTRKQFVAQDPLYKIDQYEGRTQTVVAHFPSERKAGFELAKGTYPEKANEIIVGYHFADTLLHQSVKDENVYDENGNPVDKYFYQGDLLGKTIQATFLKINGEKEETKTFTLKIVGIAEKPSRDWLTDTRVFISEQLLKEIETFTETPKGAVNGEEIPNDPAFTKEKTYDDVKLYANSVEDVKKIVEELNDHHYISYSIVNELEEINMMFAIMKAGLIFIGTIAIIIAAIGIYNTMTMAVTERAPDIGIMKAIGAHPKIIKKIFLLESGYIGFIGAIIGTVIAYGISKLVNMIFPLIVEAAFNENIPETINFSYIPWSLPVICIVICLAVTLISGYRPAQRATKIDVLKAMRREI